MGVRENGAAHQHQRPQAFLALGRSTLLFPPDQGVLSVYANYGLPGRRLGGSLPVKSKSKTGAHGGGGLPLVHHSLPAIKPARNDGPAADAWSGHAPGKPRPEASMASLSSLRFEAAGPAHLYAPLRPEPPRFEKSVPRFGRAGEGVKASVSYSLMDAGAARKAAAALAFGPGGGPHLHRYAYSREEMTTSRAVRGDGGGAARPHTQAGGFCGSAVSAYFLGGGGVMIRRGLPPPAFRRPFTEGSDRTGLLRMALAPFGPPSPRPSTTAFPAPPAEDEPSPPEAEPSSALTASEFAPPGGPLEPVASQATLSAEASGARLGAGRRPTRREMLASREGQPLATVSLLPPGPEAESLFYPGASAGLGLSGGLPTGPGSLLASLASTSALPGARGVSPGAPLKPRAAKKVRPPSARGVSSRGAGARATAAVDRPGQLGGHEGRFMHLRSGSEAVILPFGPGQARGGAAPVAPEPRGDPPESAALLAAVETAEAATAGPAGDAAAASALMSAVGACPDAPHALAARASAAEARLAARGALRESLVAAASSPGGLSDLPHLLAQATELGLGVTESAVTAAEDALLGGSRPAAGNGDNGASEVGGEALDPAAAKARAQALRQQPGRVIGGKYEVIKVVGEGAYGVVMKCKRLAEGDDVALKEFKIEDDDPDAETVRRTSRREVDLLQGFSHPHIVGYLGDFYASGNRLYVVMEFVPHNLLEVLEAQGGAGLDREFVRRCIFQLVQAIQFVHAQRIVYRDIKPENILIDRSQNLKLCDFGFARRIASPDDMLTDYVATRWYRAPELLLGPPFYELDGSQVFSPYGTPVDIWAIGCLMMELTDGEPLFPGESDIDQLHCIQKLLGPIPPAQQALFARNPLNEGIAFEGVATPVTLEAKYDGVLSAVELDFVRGLLQLDPAARLSGEQCLAHPYFSGLGVNATMVSDF